MDLGTDTLRTIAILDDSPYLRGVERMAAATHGVGRTNGLDRLAGGMTLAGGLMVGLGVKAIKTASQFQQMQMSLKRMSGSDDLFNNLKKFTLDTPYTTSFWADQARMLQGFGITGDKVIPVMKRLGDAVTGAYGIDEERLKRLIFATGEMEKGFGNARHVNMFQRAGYSPYASIEKYLGLDENQIANIGRLHIPGKYVNAAIQQGMQDDPQRADAMEQHLHTLDGATHKLSEAWQMFMAQAGSGALAPVTSSVRWLADQVSRLADPGASKSLGYLILYGGPAMLAAGPLVRAISLWKGMTAAKNLATIASNTERNAEIAKMPVLEAETAAVTTATTRWGAFGTAIAGVAAKGALLAGLAVAIQAVADASESLGSKDGSNRVDFDARYQDFRRNRVAGAGSDILHLGRTAAHVFTGGLSARTNFDRMAGDASRIIGDSNNAQALAAYERLKPRIDNVEKNWSGVSWSEVTGITERLNTIVQGAKASKDAGGAAANAMLDAQQNTAKAYNKSLLAEYNAHKGDYMKEKKGKAPSAADNPLDQAEMAEDRSETMMKIAGLRFKRTGAEKDHEAYNAARKRTLSLIDSEIAALTHHADAIEHVRGKAKEWLSTEKQVQSLMEKHEELESDKLDKDKRNKLDKHIATLLGAGGLSEQEFLKKTGINGRYLSQLGKPPSHENTVSKALKTIASRPMVINLQLDNKPFAQIKAQIKDEIFRDLEKVMSGSSPRAIFGGN